MGQKEKMENRLFVNVVNQDSNQAHVQCALCYVRQSSVYQIKR